MVISVAGASTWLSICSQWGIENICFIAILTLSPQECSIFTSRFETDPRRRNSLAASLRNYLPRQREILSAKQNLSLSPAQRVIDEFSSAWASCFPMNGSVFCPGCIGNDIQPAAGRYPANAGRYPCCAWTIFVCCAHKR